MSTEPQDYSRPHYRPYLRVSTERQATEGTGLIRQAGRDDTSDAAIAERLRLPLAPPMMAGAVSSFRGLNVTRGVLADYLKRLRAGAVPRGDVIGLDQWSRLTRMPLSRSSHLLTELMHSGVGVHVRQTNTLITAQVVDGVTGVMDLAMALIHLKLAHDQSAEKSRYNRLAIDQRHAEAATTGRIRTAATPAWLRVEGGTYTEALRNGTTRRFVVREDRARVVRRIYSEAVTTGADTIAAGLNRDWQAGHAWCAPFGAERKGGSGGWYAGSVIDILRNPAVYGMVVRTGTDIETGKRYTLAEAQRYLGYPAVVPKDEYDRVQSVLDRRRLVKPDALGRKAGKGGRKGYAVPNLFSGLCICGVCKGPVTLYTSRPGNSHKKGPRAKRVFAYVRCRAAKIGAGCPSPAVNYEHVERAVLDVLANLPVETFRAPAADASPAEQERDALKRELDQITARTAALDDATPDELILLRPRLAAWGKRAREINERIAVIERQIAVQAEDAGEHLLTIKRLRATALTTEGEERIDARRQMADALSRVIESVVVTRTKMVVVRLRALSDLILVRDGVASRLIDNPEIARAARAHVAGNRVDMIAEHDAIRAALTRGDGDAAAQIEEQLRDLDALLSR